MCIVGLVRSWWLLLGTALTAQHSWQQIDGPTMNSYPFFAPGAFTAPTAYDVARNRLLLVDYGERLFEHDGVRWLFRGYAGSTTFLLRDPVGGGILRGILGAGGLRLESWTGSGWSSLPGLLAGLVGMGIPAFDAVRNRLVVLGTTGSSSWAIHEWDGQVWQQVATLPAQAAYSNALAFDPIQARTMLRFSGAGVEEIWAWNGVSLVQLGTAPRINSFGAFWNPATARIEYVGSATTTTGLQAGLFGWNGTTFVQVAPLPTAFAQLSTACCDAVGRVHYVQASTLDGLGGVWVFQNGGWQASAAGRGSLRVAGGMAFAPSLGQLVFTGGLAHSTDRFRGTSVWDGDHWSWTAAAPAPLRGHTTCAVDPLGRGIVLFGGEASTGNPFGYGVRDDTWLWNGSSWSSLPSGPPARSYCAMVLDSARQRVVMSGGYASAAGVPVPLADTWEWSGASWSSAANMPFALARHAMAFDVARGRTVVFGGVGAAGYRNDTLEWDGIAWTQPLPPQPPPAGLPSMVFDPDRNLTMLVVHAASGEQAWHWNGTSWTQDPAPLPPLFAVGGLFSSGCAPHVDFDSVRRRVLYHNGVALFAFSPTPSAAVTYGSGCGRAVQLVMATPARVGGVLQFDLLGAVPQGLTAVGIGLGAGSVGLGNGCTLLLQTSVGSTLASANATGFAALLWAVPHDLALRGTTVYAQGAVLDPNSPGGFALTVGIAATVGD